MKNLIFFLLRWTGFVRLWRYYRRNDVGILMLHGIMDSERSDGWKPLRPQLSPERLDAFLRALSRNYSFVSLCDAVDMLTGRIPVRPNSLAITFDDGYRNNLTHALPVLRRYGVPATFFIATGNVERRKPYWFDRLDFALQNTPIEGRDVRIGQDTIRLVAGDRDSLRRSYKRLRDAAKSVFRRDTEMHREMEELAATMEKECGQSIANIFEENDWSALLSWEETRGAASEGITIGSHTVDHIRLGLIDDETAREQLILSKESIERNTGVPCRFLCYPSGSYKESTLEIARNCGYDAAVTTEEGMNRVGDDPMTLRRINVPAEGTVTELLIRVSRLNEIKGWMAAALRGARFNQPRRDWTLGD